ncbi:MAG: hypothetical protein A2X77_01620 [Gammaproteobacteria bacterium GWE2_42_36]|nr:MAG: hypothetical protein A2X77_01620 [Gammaproteobacteria bacterium GWE2_42_36]HCU05248.1 hypothetical protein [Coxiellaceae bacterium]
MDMTKFNLMTVIIYSLGIVGWLILWKWLVGYPAFKHKKLLYLVFIGAIFTLVINAIFSIAATIPPYDTELKLYAYVEENSKTVAQLSLTICLFIAVGFTKLSTLMAMDELKRFIWLIFWSLFIAVIGCLPLYWMPASDFWLTALRHLKTVPYIYSLFLLGAAAIFFIYALKYRQRKS